MISENEQPEKEPEFIGDDGGVNEPEERKMLTPKEMSILLQILIITVKGITVPQKTFDEWDKDAKIDISFDETNQLWRIWVPKPRKRGIVKPQKRIIFPNGR